MLRTLTILAVLALSGCATYSDTRMSERVVYRDGSYYSPSADGYGDYYYAPEYRYDDYYDRYWYSNRYDFFPYSYGYRSCAFSYRRCPFGYSPWRSGWGFSIFFGDPWGWPFSSWRHHRRSWHDYDRDHHWGHDDRDWQGRDPRRHDESNRPTTPLPPRTREPSDVGNGRLPRDREDRNFDERPIFRNRERDEGRAPPRRLPSPPQDEGGQERIVAPGYRPMPPRAFAPPPPPAPRAEVAPRDEESQPAPRRERDESREERRDGDRRRPRLQ